MAGLDETIVQQYAQHLLAKAGSVVRNWTIGGVVFGAVLGAAPTFLEHNFIAHGAAGKLAVVLGALAGGIGGRTAGEKRALDLRFQAQMSLRQLEVEHRLVAPVTVAPIAPAEPPVSVPVAPAPVAPPAVAPQPVYEAPPPIARAPLVAPVPVIAPVQVSIPAPVVAPPAPEPVVMPEPEPVAAEVVVPEPQPEPLHLAPVPLAAVPAEQPAAPPLIAVAPMTPVPATEPPPAVPTPPVAVAPPVGPRLAGDGPELPPVSLDSAG
jgi:hypothetical protein